MHWGITYLREDIQDLRSAVRAMHDRMDTLTQSVLRSQCVYPACTTLPTSLPLSRCGMTCPT